MTSRPVTLKEYFARDGSPYSNKDARIIGPVIEALAESGGAVTARDVLDAARSTNSPLHPYFEWDDKRAADLHRLQEAKNMLRAIKIKFTDGHQTYAARAFPVERITTFVTGPRQFRSFKVLHGESAFAAEMMQMAISDLRAWRSKYQPYEPIWDNFSEAFGAVINQIAECEDELIVQNLPAVTDDAVRELLEWRERFAAAHATWVSWVEQMKFMLAAIADAERVFNAADVMKHRDCIRCGKSFVSFDAGHRMCKSCAELKGADNVAGLLPGQLI